MKIALFSQPRSRSSLLINSVSDYYKIKNHFEYFQSISNSFLNRNLKSRAWPEYCQYIENSVVKIHSAPHCIKYIPTNFINVFDEFNKSIIDVMTDDTNNYIVNLVDFLQLKEYDKIYITYRSNLTESICSMNNANMNRSWWMKEKKSLPYKSIDLGSDEVRHYILRLIFTKILLEKIEISLTKNNIKFTKLNYDEIPVYVDKQYPGAKPGLVETEIDYRQLTPNYKEIDQWINENYNNLRVMSSGILFS